MEPINPAQTGGNTTDSVIRIVSIFLGIRLIYLLVEDFSLLLFMVRDSSARWDFSMVVYFLPFILLPAALVLFWLRKKIGWMLAVIYSLSMAVGTILRFIMEAGWESRFPAIDGLSPVTPLTSHLATLLIFGGMTWTLCKKNMTDVYKVDRRTMFVTIGIGVGLELLIFLWYKIN